MRLFRLKIKRQDRPEGQAYWEAFEIPWRANMNVIVALQEIRKRPVTINGRAVPPIVWAEGCDDDDCGVCTMIVNGKAKQACAVLLSTLEQPVSLEPLSKFPVVRDLLVERDAVFDAFRRVKAWVDIDVGRVVEGVIRVNAKDNSDSELLARCTSCGACLEACPQYTATSDFIGAAAISRAGFYNRHHTGSFAANERLDAVMDKGGIEDCGNAQNCVKACPAGIPLTESLAEMRRAVTKRAFQRVFGG